LTGQDDGTAVPGPGGPPGSEGSHQAEQGEPRYQNSLSLGSPRSLPDRSACTGAPCTCEEKATCPARADAAERGRREAETAASTATAAAAGGMPESSGMSAALISSVLAPLRRSVIACRVADGLRGLRAPRSRGGPWAVLQARLQADHMVRNSLYLILSSGLQAALGFAFWIIVARLFSTTDVGKASSLVAATTVIAYFALVGLNNTFVRYLPTAPDRDALLTAGFLLVGICGAGMGLVYVFLTPFIAPRLSFLRDQPALAAGFVLLTAAAAVNLLTDSVFIASRKAGFAALTDGAIGGVTRLVSAVVLVGTGAYGIFCASAGGYAAAALASLVLITTSLHSRPSLRQPFRTLQPLLRFSSASYAGNVFSMLPILVVPLIVLDRLGASEAAYYFVAFQIATLLYSTVYAVETTFLAEGSHTGVDQRELLKRSRRVLMALCLPACLVLIVAAHWVLLVFGKDYSQHATPSVILFAVGVIPIAANNWLQTLLRLLGRLRAIVWTNVIYATAICGLAWFLAPHGLAALTAAWPIGVSIGAAAAAIPCRASLTSQQAVGPPRYRPSG
jgi:O-antigen/teichoic acid export membrane protein